MHLLFNVHIIVNFPLFLLLLISSFIPCDQKRSFYYVSPLKYIKTHFMVNCVLWSILDNVPCALEKSVYPAIVGGSVVSMSVRYH